MIDKGARWVAAQDNNRTREQDFNAFLNPAMSASLRTSTTISSYLNEVGEGIDFWKLHHF